MNKWIGPTIMHYRGGGSRARLPSSRRRIDRLRAGRPCARSLKPGAATRKLPEQRPSLQASLTPVTTVSCMLASCAMPVVSPNKIIQILKTAQVQLLADWVKALKAASSPGAKTLISDPELQAQC